MLEKKAVTSVPVHDIIASRWSIRAFDPFKKVSMEQIISVCEAARWAPSCGSEEPWRFIIWDKKTDYSCWDIAFNCLDDNNKKWVGNAPVLIAGIACNTFKRNNTPNFWAKFDTGASCQNIYLQSVALGLMSHPMGGFDRDKLKNQFSIPDNYTPIVMIALGYQGDLIVLDDFNQKREVAERTRKPLGSNFFFCEWEKPITQ